MKPTSGFTKTRTLTNLLTYIMLKFMRGQRHEYPIQIIFNGKEIRRVLIDQHYLEGHAESMDDKLILKLVKTLGGEIFPVEEEDDGFQYFTVEPVFHASKPYRVILVMCLQDDFLGVINAFRVNL